MLDYLILYDPLPTKPDTERLRKGVMGFLNIRGNTETAILQN